MCDPQDRTSAVSEGSLSKFCAHDGTYEETMATDAASGPSWAASLGSHFSKLDSTSLVVFSVVCVLVLVLIIALIVWRIRRSDLKSTVLVKDPIQMFGSGAVPLTVVASKIPPTLSGQEYSYSFWVYLVQYTATGSAMLLFSRGMQTGRKGGSPLVYLDKSTNIMYVSVATTTTAAIPTLDTVRASQGYVTAKIDYVPLQRWVNVAFVVQDYLLTVYMDGDIYSVVNVTDPPNAGSGGAIVTTRPSFTATSGDVVVGDTSSQPQAFMSQLLFFNYALTQQNVYACYSAGPLAPSAMSLIGVPAYGIRSPIYKLG